MPRVSVIIPVYNAEKFLPRCIESILGQSMADIEVIAVNDASADSSLGVLRRYADADSRLRVIDKTRNEGSYMARDTGFRAARGEYLFFCDADDFLPPDSLAILDRKARETGADIIAGDLAIYREDGHKHRMIRAARLTSDPDDYIRAILSGVTNSQCGALFRRKLFTDFDYPDLHGQCFSDDRIVLLNILLKARPVICPVEEVTYYYYLNTGSMTRSTFSNEKMRKLVGSLYYCYKFLKDRTSRFDFENERFLAKNLSFFIEQGYSASIIEDYNSETRRLLCFSEMRRLLGTHYAVHSALCRRSTIYRRMTDSCRNILWRIKGKL